jgi:DNA-binding transcriptional LysR family regulator
MLPDFNRLKIFYYIYSCKSNAEAARKLYITQSAVSQQLRKLEAEIKSPLFTRLHKRLVPTSAGERLFQILQPFLTELEAGVRNIKKARKVPSGLLRIGAPVEFGRQYMANLFAPFRVKYPDVNLFLKLGDPEVLMPLVEEGTLDFAYVDVFSNAAQFFNRLRSFDIEPLIEEEVILACSREYYTERIGGDHSLGNLMSQDFIAYQQNAHAIQSWFNYTFGRTLRVVNAVLTVDSLMAVVSAIRNHLGLGVIVSHFVSEEIDRGDIVPIFISGKKVVNHISLIQLADKKPNMTEKAFQGHIRNEMRPLGILAKLRSPQLSQGSR